MSEDLHGCPFCGFQHVQADELSKGLYAVCCDRCGAHGPVEDSPGHAQAEWNRRGAEKTAAHPPAA